MRAQQLVALLLVAGCDPDTVMPPGMSPAPPVELAFGIMSRVSTQQTQALFGASASLKHEPDRAHKDCPRFDRATITVTSVSEGAFSGALRLSYANNRLYLLKFFPQEYQRYVESLGDRGVPLDPPAGTMLPVRASTHESGSGSSYVMWEDTAIGNEVRAWQRRCK